MLTFVALIGGVVADPGRPAADEMPRVTGEVASDCHAVVDPFDPRVLQRVQVGTSGRYKHQSTIK